MRPRAPIIRAGILVAVVFLAALLARRAPAIRSLPEPLTALQTRVAGWAIGASPRDERTALRAAYAALLAERTRLERRVFELETAARNRPPALRIPTIPARVTAGVFDGGTQALIAATDPADDRRPVATVAAFANGALLGMVESASGHRVRVRLLTDHRSRIPAARTDDGRTLGIVSSNAGGGLVLMNIPNDRTVSDGDRIVTGTGFVGIPPGIPIGTVSDLRPDADGFFRTATLQSIADPRSTIVLELALTP